VNPDNIEPGATTCGFLHTTLGAEPGVNYPIIRVYICMKFAMNQPAPSGSIVVHCGGKSNSPFWKTVIIVIALMLILKYGTNIERQYFD